MFKAFSAGFGLFAAAFLLPAHPASAEEPARSELQIAVAYVEAYNARDLPAMLELMHDDVEWLSIEDSKVVAFATGKADLAAQMEAYLASPSATLSTVEGSVTDGRFVAVREVAHWTDAEGNARSQSALAVYEIEHGLVRRVWYYPATR
ncbi:MAG: nuclear transport factor 2 family protein [Erythrobacter sp.]|nr:nuclear transport factor 2 family protein [Erythrobacter sp.]